MLRIDLTPLSEGIHHIVLEPDPQALDLDPEQFAAIRVEATLDLFSDRALVTFQAAATATLTCDRTLVSFEQPIEGSCRLFFAPPSFVEDEDAEEAYDEVRVLNRTDRSIDLTDSARDTLLLAVPARKVAPGAEDLDIPMTYGEPADGGDIDPRWQALRALQPGDNPD